jgi:thiamine biosynthesis lipoprotein
VRATAADARTAHAAIDAAFDEIAEVHRLMSFHEPQSELAMINRRAWKRPVRVDPRTFEVLAWARTLSQQSGGCFNVTCGARVVEAGALPRPRGAPAPDPRGDWRDVELDPDRSEVRMRTPVLIDLGGLAKGYAVDRAMARLAAAGAGGGCVDAGGDLRVFGPEPERVLLRPGGPTPAPVIGLQDCALASSCSGAAPDMAAHIDGSSGARAPVGRFVAVAAPTCMAADALAKLAMARGRSAQGLLESCGAKAWLLDPGGDWLELGAGP